MKKIFTSTASAAFWKNYWDRIGSDQDKIIDHEYYPFTFLGNYLNRRQMIVEAGCGAGRVLKGLHNDGHSIMGFDYDPGCVSRVAADGDYRVFAGDLQKLALKKDSVDAILCFGVISCLEDEPAIHRGLQELKRVLRKDGILIISLLNYNLLRFAQRWLGNLQAIFSEKKYHGWAASQKELTDLLNRYVTVIDRGPSISRQPFYDYAPFLRAAGSIDPRRARVDDREYRLNCIGTALFEWCRKKYPESISGSITFVCRNDRKSPA